MINKRKEKRTLNKCIQRKRHTKIENGKIGGGRG
jgi:hypothetical protein